MPFPIYCSDPEHDIRKGEKGWQIVIGEASVPNLEGHKCEACSSVKPSPLRVKKLETVKKLVSIIILVEQIRLELDDNFIIREALLSVNHLLRFILGILENAT